MLSIIGAIIRDKFDNVFHSDEEIKEDLKLPILGIFPYVKLLLNAREEKSIIFDFLSENETEDNPTISKYEKFFFQESLRNIFTSIRFLNVDKPLKIIALTSSIPKEGKSLLSILIGKTIADLGKKVLLIDGDMRKPQLHQRIGLDNIVGLSNYLTNNEKSIDEFIQETVYVENLKIMTSGTKPPDPIRLLGSNKLDTLFTELRESEEFDYIIIDCPPTIGMSDVNLLADKCDGAILIILKRVLLTEPLLKIR